MNYDRLRMVEEVNETKVQGAKRETPVLILAEDEFYDVGQISYDPERDIILIETDGRNFDFDGE